MPFKKYTCGGKLAYLVHEKAGSQTIADEDNPIPVYAYGYPFVDIDVSDTRDTEGFISSTVLTGLGKTKTITPTRNANKTISSLTVVIT